MKELALGHFDGSDSAHDLGHALRVLALAEVIGEAEGSDMGIVRPAALVHDIGCAPKHLGREGDSEARTLVIARGLLKRAGYGEDRIEAILGVIEVHGYSRGIVPDTLEGKVLQDADRLDAMGAVGVARTFLVSGSTNRPIYAIDDPWAEAREVDDGAYGLDHFFRKLLRLKDGMHTATARRLAVERHAFLESFIDAIRKEIG